MLHTQWAKLEENENYAVSAYGDVINLTNNRIKTGRSNGLGYLQVHLWKNNIGKNFYVHRLVLKYFLNSTFDVNHIDGNKTNNTIENLEATTKSDNIKHALATKLLTRDSLGQFRTPMEDNR